MMKALKPLGHDLAQRPLTAMALSVDRIQGHGQGAIVGAAGELEHGALWHVPGAYPLRELLGWRDRASISRWRAAAGPAGQLGNALAIVPSTKKVGPLGAELDVPLTPINAAYVRSHFDAIVARVNDALRADEILVAVAVTASGRPYARIDGLPAPEMQGEDGLR